MKVLHEPVPRPSHGSRSESRHRSWCRLPRAVAEIFRERLYSEQRGAKTYVYGNSREGTIPIEAAVAKLRETPRLARLFSPEGKLDLKEMSQPEYLAIRKTHPELFGLRK